MGLRAVRYKVGTGKRRHVGRWRLWDFMPAGELPDLGQLVSSP